MGRKKPVLRCIHRHTIEEHPACFAQGKILYDFRDDREWERLTKIPWYQFPGYKIGYLDIEVDNLKANFGTILAWSIKEKGGDVTSGLITKKELFNGKTDKRVVKEILEEMKKYKILVGYYSTKHDIPFIRSKALHYNFEFPGYGTVYHWDLYYTVRAKLKLHRNSLVAATEYLGIKGKTFVPFEAWRKAKYGDVKSLQEILKHNVGDVVILEKLHDRIYPFRKWIRKSV